MNELQKVKGPIETTKKIGIIVGVGYFLKKVAEKVTDRLVDRAVTKTQIEIDRQRVIIIDEVNNKWKTLFWLVIILGSLITIYLVFDILIRVGVL